MARGTDLRPAVPAIPDRRGGAGRPGSVPAQRAALGAALEDRSGDVLAICQRAFEEAQMAEDPSLARQDPMWELIGLAVGAIAGWLQTGEGADAGVRSEIASLGRTAAQWHRVPGGGEQAGRVRPGGTGGTRAARVDRDKTPSSLVTQLSVAMFTKLNFWWSDATSAVLEEEGRRLGIDAAVVGEAREMVARSSRASLVDMAALYDAELRSLQDALSHLARHDPLTGLANRAVLLDRLAQSLARLGRHPGGLAVVFVDLDNFKAVNDVRGHAVGDAVLCETATRLTSEVRPEDLVARIGGDEFVVVFEDLATPRDEGPRMAERLRARAGVPMDVGEEQIALTISAGVAVVCGPGRTPEDVLAAADAVMYRAKRGGRNRVAVVELGTPRARPDPPWRVGAPPPSIAAS